MAAPKPREPPVTPATRPARSGSRADRRDRPGPHRVARTAARWRVRRRQEPRPGTPDPPGPGPRVRGEPHRGQQGDAAARPGQGATRRGGVRSAARRVGQRGGRGGREPGPREPGLRRVDALGRWDRRPGRRVVPVDADPVPAGAGRRGQLRRRDRPVLVRGPSWRRRGPPTRQVRRVGTSGAGRGARAGAGSSAVPVPGPAAGRRWLRGLGAANGTRSPPGPRPPWV